MDLAKAVSGEFRPGYESFGRLRSASMSVQLWQFMLVALSGWMNRQQQQIIEYLKEENRSLREQLGGKRLRFTDDQRRPTPGK